MVLDYSVSTLASHSALQILKGAKDEGFRTVLVSTKGRLKVYRRFKFIDEVVVVGEFDGLVRDDILSRLRRLNCIMVPHGSFVEYVGLDNVERMPIPIFGNRRIFRWEADQRLKMKLLCEAGIRVPMIFESPEDIDRLVIVKFPGAKGGRGYFLASTPEEFSERLASSVERGLISAEDAENPLIQEYIVGVPMYFHYFYSPLTGELELLGIDIRYESNVDGLHRLPSTYRSQHAPTFVVVGNIPVVVRESLLEEVFEYGERFVDAAEKLIPPGIIGPFCLEAICTDNLDIVVFEFSARIVAGTNLYVNGSPYSSLYYNEPMSMGRRIAREIREAIETDNVNKVLT